MAFKCQRWTVANILPVGLMLSIILTIWTLYLWLHLLPLLTGQIGRSACMAEVAASKAAILPDAPIEPSCLQAAFSRGLAQAVVQQVLTALLLACFGRAVLTDPGSVPDSPEWLPDGQPSARGPEEIGVVPDGESRKMPKPHEVKHTGARRFCKWCNRFKPDRSHHCRVCRSCILRMDHHCPWIVNCVGFRNHKFFYLLVLYSLLDCAFVILTISESLYRSLIEETQFSHRFLLVFCMTLSVMMGFLLMLFFMFHSWLMLRATTTIEFCEKTYRHSGCSHRGSTRSIYYRGLLSNVCAVLGSRSLLWLLPTATPEGDGLTFDVSEGIQKTAEEPAKDSTALLGKHCGGQRRGPPRQANQASSYQSLDSDDIKVMFAKDTQLKLPAAAEAASGDGRPFVASQSNIAAPEVTAGEASIS